MAEFGDSLVLKIVADSGDLQQQIEQIGSRLATLQRQLDGLNGAPQGLERLGAALTDILTPVDELNSRLQQVAATVARIGDTPLSLDITPASQQVDELSSALATTQTSRDPLASPSAESAAFTRLANPSSTETLTLTADTTQIDSAFEQVSTRLNQLIEQVREFGDSQQVLSRWAAALSGTIAPLQGLSQRLTQVTQQALALGQVTIGLNVDPALSALQILSQRIAAVQAQLASLSAGIPAGPVPTLPLLPAGPVRQFADGGLVSGPGGIDRVPAMLSAGEFVLNRQAVQQFGVPFLQQANHGDGSVRSAAPAVSTSDAASSSVTNQFGGITVQVQAATDISTLLDGLARDELHLRARRG